MALGSGEALNEHITGERWPEKPVRNARLRECVDVMRALFAGETVSHRGLVRVDRARLWTLPETPPPLIGAAVSAATAASVGGWADGLVTIQPAQGQARADDRGLPEHGGEGKPVFLADPRRLWPRRRGRAGHRVRSMAGPTSSRRRSARTSSSPNVRGGGALRAPGGPQGPVLISADAERFVDWLAGFAELGFERIYVHHVGKEQRPFIEPLRGAGAPDVRGISVMTLMIDDTADLWWKNAVFYCLDVETFFDGNGDGCGDFNGLTQRIDYLADLGVTCLWLMPFYPSPNRDDGYDIIDYYGVDRHLGTLGDFVEFMRTARDRGLKVIADLVVNHTSREHPLVPGRARGPRLAVSRLLRLAEEPPEDGRRTWSSRTKRRATGEWDGKAGRYFLHRFYKHQPDLNIVQTGGARGDRQIAGFWLQLGLSGFRVDAVPFLLETTGVETAPELDPHDSCATCAPFSGATAATPSCSARSISSPRSSAGSSATRTATSCTCA